MRKVYIFINLHISSTLSYIDFHTSCFFDSIYFHVKEDHNADYQLLNHTWLDLSTVSLCLCINRKCTISLMF